MPPSLLSRRSPKQSIHFFLQKNVRATKKCMTKTHRRRKVRGGKSIREGRREVAANISGQEKEEKRGERRKGQYGALPSPYLVAKHFLLCSIGLRFLSSPLSSHYCVRIAFSCGEGRRKGREREEEKVSVMNNAPCMRTRRRRRRASSSSPPPS